MPLLYQDCTFRYGRRTHPVLNGLNLALAPGHTVLLGPNGAGKSTLLSLGAGAFRPGTGRVGLGRLSASGPRDARTYRRKVAWLPQRPGFLPGLTAREHVAYIGWLKGMRERDAWAAAPAAIDRVGLAEKMNDRIKTLSGGQQQRVAIAGALVHEAEVLLLDEPTAGLDPHQRRRFLDLLVSLRGTMHVIVSTHDIGDLDQAFEEVVVLESGRVRFQGPVSLFDSHAAPDCVPGRRLESAYESVLEAAE
ncbi:ATP-binding cassette domain-containing protein [Streptomyces sp. NBC_00454]|uniref:ABC transporter ATP-binding protein n=1 Tax=Streptomyces sp. NBC_00454 TaxID=2975747 RepID=UPI002F90FC9E